MTWCASNAIAINESYVYSDGSPGGQNGNDMNLDYLAMNSPYPIIAVSAGNGGRTTNDTVESRSYDALVVGASNDMGTTATSDDTMAALSSWRNWLTPHGDYELPNLVAPGIQVSSTSQTSSGTSASSPITLGAAILTIAGNGDYVSDPEAMRASVVATATHPVTATRTTTLGIPAGDLSQGAGLLNTYALVQLGAQGNFIGPKAAGTPAGFYGKYYTFATDFDSNGWSYDTYDIATTQNGRLRAAIAWDATPSGCNLPTSACTVDTLDADLDLYVFLNGTIVCSSTTYDSSWELCDIPITAGQNLSLKVQRAGSLNTSYTFVGVAWWNYDPNNE